MHNHISKNNQSVASPNSFESREKEIAANWVIKKPPPLVATERYEVEIAPTVETLRMV